MQKVFEFILEAITSLDSNILELGQNFSEKNLARMKLVKNLSAWSKETWIIPEMNQSEQPNQTLLVGQKLSGFKKSIYNSQLKANKSQEIFMKCTNQITLSLWLLPKFRRLF